VENLRPPQDAGGSARDSLADNLSYKEMVEKIVKAISALRSIFIGMGISFKYLTRHAVTMQYPDEKWTLPLRYRGALQLKDIMGETQVEYLRTNLQDYNLLLTKKLHQDRLPPCTGGCLANVDVRGQNALVAEGKYTEAYELVRERNILPSVLGRICHHPCETACRRNYYDEFISIRELHRFIGDFYHKGKSASKVGGNRERATRKERIAIIGAGPSGLAAAYDLVNLGYKVTIFEKYKASGGQLYTCIPKYRLPRETLRADIDGLIDLGIEIKTGVEVGKDITFDDLKKQGYNAILIAVGLQLSRALPIPGAELEGILLALPFLYDANFEQKMKIGARVVVIGGGNVAVDVARCALRVGAKEVHLVCLEARNEMPAYAWEIEEALEEGIEIHCSWGPKRFTCPTPTGSGRRVGEPGKVKGIELKQCTRVFDETGRFNPAFNEDVVTEIEADTIIVAIGQASDLSFLKGTEVELTERNTLVFDKLTQATSTPGIFASGEVISGAGSAIGSIMSGHEAAVSIDRYLRGVNLKEGRALPISVQYEKYCPVDLADVEPERLRRRLPLAPAEIRKKSFIEIEKTLPKDLAVLEAERCLRCHSEICVGCGFCARTCGVYAINVIRTPALGTERRVTTYDLDLGRCIFCGLCFEQCPTNALLPSSDYEISVYKRENLVYKKEQMLRKGITLR